jgi:uncharacterized protein (DUF111 family)
MSSTGGIWVLECNLDDMSPEILAHAAEKIVQMGALDIFIASGLGKKGRPGFQMTVLCHDNEREKVISTIFNESTAIGLRQRYSDRVVLQREMQSIRIEGREVHLKIGSWQGQMLNVKPEFADVRRLAEDLDIPLKKAMQTVLGAIHEKHGLGKD